VARAVCRRTERHCWALARTEQLRAEPMHYLNRLSDLLFVLARNFARAQHGTEPLWSRSRAKEPGG
jgi:cob(I)alamin adenosyltransferase